MPNKKCQPHKSNVLQYDLLRKQFEVAKIIERKINVFFQGLGIVVMRNMPRGTPMSWWNNSVSWLLQGHSTHAFDKNGTELHTRLIVECLGFPLCFTITAKGQPCRILGKKYTCLLMMRYIRCVLVWPWTNVSVTSLDPSYWQGYLYFSFSRWTVAFPKSVWSPTHWCLRASLSSVLSAYAHEHKKKAKLKHNGEVPIITQHKKRLAIRLPLASHCHTLRLSPIHRQSFHLFSTK